MLATSLRSTAVGAAVLLSLCAPCTGRGQVNPRDTMRRATVPGRSTKPAGVVLLPHGKSIDVCEIVQGDTVKLKTLLQSITSFFPIDTSHNGKRVRLSDPKIWKYSCPNLFLEIHTHMQYWKTRGITQYQFSAGLTFTAHLKGTVYYTGPTTSPVTPANFSSARACLTDIDVVGLDIENLPTWFSDWDVVKDYVNDKLGHNACFDVTSQVSVLLALGVTL